LISIPDSFPLNAEIRSILRNSLNRCFLIASEGWLKQYRQIGEG
jgi:hypothetical protein